MESASELGTAGGLTFPERTSLSRWKMRRRSGGVQPLSEYRRSLDGETTESCRAILVFSSHVNELLQDRRTVTFMWSEIFLIDYLSLCDFHSF